MAVTIVVTPERLRRASLAARALAGRLLEVRARLRASLVGVDAALGEGEARAAFATLWTRWSGSAERLTAAGGYERADREGAQLRATPPLPPPTAGASSGGPAGRGGADAAAR